MEAIPEGELDETGFFHLVSKVTGVQKIASSNRSGIANTGFALGETNLTDGKSRSAWDVIRKQL